MSTAGSALERRIPGEQLSRGPTGWAERGWIPDALIRMGIRRLCARRLLQERSGGSEQQAVRFWQGIEQLCGSPIAIHTEAANSQHYELPPQFFRLCLGPRLKYSCAYYPHGGETLGQAEEAMLELYAERAELADGQRILELGCGWGSLTLWMAQSLPRAQILAISNSARQREFLEAECLRRGISNVRVQTEDVNRLQLPQGGFDRCVSVEMFEHMRNYETLLRNISTWLRPGGKLFVHLFAHRDLMYPFTTAAADDWLGRHFFTGGLMPALNTLHCFQHDLQLQRHWLVDGTHYERTANDWLANQDANRDAVMAILSEAYGALHAPLWFQRWRIFWMACAELFGYADGQEWLVAHYRFIRHP